MYNMHYVYVRIYIYICTYVRTYVPSVMCLLGLCMHILGMSLFHYTYSIRMPYVVCMYMCALSTYRGQYVYNGCRYYAYVRMYVGVF